MTLPFRKFILAAEGKTRSAFLSKRSENRSCSESSEGLAGWTKIVKTGRKTECDELELLFENRTDRTHGVNSECVCGGRKIPDIITETDLYRAVPETMMLIPMR